jgi:hypothetical protein
MSLVVTSHRLALAFLGGGCLQLLVMPACADSDAALDLLDHLHALVLAPDCAGGFEAIGVIRCSSSN